MKLINQLKHLHSTDLLSIKHTQYSQTIHSQGLKRWFTKIV